MRPGQILSSKSTPELSLTSSLCFTVDRLAPVDRMGDEEQFSHGGNDGKFLWFMVADEPLVGSPHYLIVLNAVEGREIEDLPYGAVAALADLPPPPHRGSRFCPGRIESDKGGDLSP